MVHQSYKTVSTNILELVQKANKSQTETSADIIHRIISRSSMLRDEIVVAKISNHILQDDVLLNEFLKNMALLSDAGARIVLVHDIGDAFEYARDILGIDEEKFKAQNISDYKSMNLIEMIVSGHVNKKIVSILCDMHVNAIGVSGKDCEILKASQRICTEISSEQKRDNVVRIGFVSDPAMINIESVISLLDSGMMIVFSPIATSIDGGSTCLVDANICSALMASAMVARYLILPCEKHDFGGEVDFGGIVLGDKNRQFIEHMKLDSDSSENLRIILDVAANALDNNVESVCISDENDPGSILSSIFCSK